MVLNISHLKLKTKNRELKTNPHQFPLSTSITELQLSFQAVGNSLEEQNLVVARAVLLTIKDVVHLLIGYLWDILSPRLCGNICMNILAVFLFWIGSVVW